MTDHDQFFKKLLTTFFSDLLRIIVPEIAPELRAEDATFLMQESFSAFAEEGDRAIVDLLARVPTKDDQKKIVLVHTEVEARHRSIMARRMLFYYMHLRLKHDLPVLPIVVNLRGGPAGITKQVVTDTVASAKINTFHYYVLGLEKSEAETFLSRPEPLAWGLAALMRSKGVDLAKLRFRCLRTIGHAHLDEQRERILLNLVGTYLKLEGDDQRRYDDLLKKEGDQVMEAIEMTWEGKLKAKGRTEGIQSVLLRQAEWRFGPLPDAVRQRLEAITDPTELNQLSRRLLEARSLEELELGT